MGSIISGRKPVTSGVPQGSVLGPLLFLVYVNDLMVGTQCEWKAFADDYKLCTFEDRAGGHQDSLGSLQRDLDILTRKSESWNLVLNHGKCKVMRFGKGRSLGEALYSVNGNILEVVNSYRDLGVVVDASLKFHLHVREVVYKAGGLLSNLLRTTVCRSMDFMVALYVSHVRPIMEYCSCVWGTGYLGDLRLLESLQRRWTREVEGLSLMEYSERLKRMGLFSVRGRMLRMDMVKVWKAFHCEIDVGLASIWEVLGLGRTRGHSLRLRMPVCRSESRRRWFSVRVLKQWNALPACVVESSTLVGFKRELDAYLGDKLFEASA